MLSGNEQPSSILAFTRGIHSHLPLSFCLRHCCQALLRSPASLMCAISESQKDLPKRDKPSTAVLPPSILEFDTRGSIDVFPQSAGL